MLASYPRLLSLHNWEIIFSAQTKLCFGILLQQHKTISYSYCCSQNNSCPCVVWSLLHVDLPLPGICTQPFSASCIAHSSATAPHFQDFGFPGGHRTLDGDGHGRVVLQCCANHARFMCSAEGRVVGSVWVCLLRACVPASLPGAWHLPGDQYFKPKIINDWIRGKVTRDLICIAGEKQVWFWEEQALYCTLLRVFFIGLCVPLLPRPYTGNLTLK